MTPEDARPSVNVTVKAPAKSALDDLQIAGQGDDATITQGDDENVSVLVENVGGQSGEFTIELDIGGQVTDTETTGTLESNDTETVTFSTVTGGLAPGDYNVEVSTEDSDSTVTGDLTVELDTPIVFDGGLTSPDNTAIQFDIQSTENTDTTINGIQIESQIGDGSEVWSDDNTVDITGSQQDGFIEGGGNPAANALDANGNSEELDTDAIISPEDTATVFVGDFGESQGNDFETVDDFAGFERVSEADDWDIRITLELVGEDDADFYFEET